MIYAIGHDLVENRRIEQMIADYGQRSLSRILTKAELALLAQRSDKIRFVAKRFAAKEAFAKACGTGLRQPVVLSNISILNDKLGKPYIAVAAELQLWLDQHGIIACHLSLSDERSLSSALVILEC